MTTKKEFIAKILEVGKGEPINTRGMPGFKVGVENQWLYSKYENRVHISYWTKTYVATIINIRLHNPPKIESDIYFKQAKSLENVDVIPADFTDAIVKQLYKQPTGTLRLVTLPSSAQKALYSLQDEPTEREYGGGIDFEIVNDQPQLERILLYYGEKGRVPGRIIKKYGDDVEVQFHTHPDEEFAQPSIADIDQFISTPHQLSFIVAANEILVLEKTRNTPKEVARKLSLGDMQVANASSQKEILNEITKEFNIRTTIVPRKTDLKFNLNIIRGL